MATTATQVTLDTPAAEFRLPGTDGKTYALDDVAGEKGTVVVFICNHCPYVKAVIDRMVADARVLLSEGVGLAAICSNDAASYPEDSFENMKRFAKAHARTDISRAAWREANENADGVVRISLRARVPRLQQRQRQECKTDEIHVEHPLRFQIGWRVGLSQGVQCTAGVLRGLVIAALFDFFQGP